MNECKHLCTSYNNGDTFEISGYDYATGHIWLKKGAYAPCGSKLDLVNGSRKEQWVMADSFEIGHCMRCGKDCDRQDLRQSKDCKGIPYRLVCLKCIDEIWDIGYDGVLYDDSDENVSEDW